MIFSLLPVLVSGLLGIAAAQPAGFERSVRHPTDLRARQSSGPMFTYYSDKWENSGSPPDPSEIPGWNVFALSFWLSSGAADMALGWTELTADERSTIKSTYQAAGVKLIVAAFGSTEYPTTNNEDPTATAQALAAFVQQWDLDGVDIDYEDTTAMNGGTAVAWLTTFQDALRAALPAGQYIISHAPVAPWFTDDTSTYTGGDYLDLDKAVGSSIDFYNVQFYNQGTSAYTDCGSLITSSAAALPSYPHTALMEIIANGVDGSKLLIGKPGNTGDASTGYVDPATLATCVQQAQGQGWNGGLMVWEYPDAPSNYVDQVWGSTPSGGGGSGNTTSSAPAPSSTGSVSPAPSSSSPAPSSGSVSPSSPAPSPSPSSGSVSPSTGPSSSAPAPSSSGSSGSGGSCAAAWVSSTAYTQGQTVSYNGDNWTALYWTENDTPGGSADVWQNAGACTSNGVASKTRHHARSFGRPTHLPRRVSSWN